MYFVFCRLYLSSLQSPRQCLALRVHTEWQRPLFGVHSIMEKLAQVSVGGGARPPPFTFTITYTMLQCTLQLRWADTLTLFRLYQYMYSVVWLLPVISLLLTYTEAPVRACLTIWLERFRGCQKEDKHWPLSILLLNERSRLTLMLECRC